MKKLHVSTLIILIACIAAFAVLVFVEGPNVIKTQVKGLQLEQDGTEIKATWDEMDCQEYNLTFTCEGKKTTITGLNETKFTIPNVMPDKTYSVSVEALLESGKTSTHTVEKFSSVFLFFSTKFVTFATETQILL